MSSLPRKAAFTDAQVECGRDLAAQAAALKGSEPGLPQLELGDLTLHILPYRAKTERQAKTVLAPFAEAIGVKWTELQKYRANARVFPPGVRRPELGWTVHRELRTARGAQKLLHSRDWTTNEATRYRKRLRAANAPAPVLDEPDKPLSRREQLELSDPSRAAEKDVSAALAAVANAVREMDRALRLVEGRSILQGNGMTAMLWPEALVRVRGHVEALEDWMLAGSVGDQAESFLRDHGQEK